MTEDKFLKLFRAHIFDAHGTQDAAANHWGVSGNLVSLIVRGLRPPSERMLRDAGYKRSVARTVTYKKAKS